MTTPVLKSHFCTLEWLLLLLEKPSQKRGHLSWQRCNPCQQLLPLSLSGAEGHSGRDLPAQPVPGLLDTPHSKGPLEQWDAGGKELKVGLRSGGDSWWLDAAHGGRQAAGVW